MDRQLRNISLLTLLIAALGSVAVLSAEQHRAMLNTLILGVAALAAVGSGGALVGGSVWFGVVRKDVAQVWNNLPHRRWHTSQRLAFDLKEEAKIAGADLVITVPNENAARAAGVPCMILELSPRRMHYSLKRPLRGSTITCEVIRGRFAGRESRAVEVPTDQEIYNSAVARFPDEWFNADEAHPLPGRYRAAWTLHLANSSTTHVSGRFQRLTTLDNRLGWRLQTCRVDVQHPEPVRLEVVVRKGLWPLRRLKRAVNMPIRFRDAPLGQQAQLIKLPWTLTRMLSGRRYAIQSGRKVMELRRLRWEPLSKRKQRSPCICGVMDDGTSGSLRRLLLGR